jgi:integrase
MKIKYYPARKCFRVIVPARLNNKERKDKAFYFKERIDAEKKIREVLARGTQASALSDRERAILSLAEKNDLPIEQIEDAFKHFKTSYLSLTKHATLVELVEIYLKHLQKEQLAPTTQNAYRQRLDALCLALGDIDVATINPLALREYLGSFPPGGNRRTHHKIVRTFIRWAYHNGYLATDLMDRIRPMDRWKSNKDIIDIEDYRRLLFVCAGLESPKSGVERISRYLQLLPYFVLGGLCGMRRCEILRDHLNEQILAWDDINWAKNLIIVRHEVAKETPADDRRRYIPLEPAAREWLQLVAGTSGPVVDIYQSRHTLLCRELFGLLGFRLPKNGLRNSYASYAQTFRSPGDVAKACGDLEQTIRRFYTQALEPDEGKAWFDIRPNSSRKIISLAV